LGAFISPVGDAYGKKGLAKASHRVAMCQLALQDSDWIVCDDWEAKQDEYLTTIKVLTHYRKEIDAIYPNDQVRILLCCGSDLLGSMCKPGVWADEDIDAIFSKYGIMCLEREGVDLRRMIYEADLLYRYRPRIILVPQYISNNISSTKVRQMVRRGLSIRYIVPSKVVSYIEENSLYQDKTLEKQVSVFGNI